MRKSHAWAFADSSEGNIGATVTIPQEIAWRLFTKGIDRESARNHLGIQGDAALGEVVFQLTAIVG